MIDGLPATGPNPQKVRFYKELATGMQFLAMWHSLSPNEQAGLMELLKSMQADVKPGKKDDK